MQDAQAVPEWRTRLVVQGVELGSGQAVLVTVGLVSTAAGGVQVALRVGEDRLVVLPLQGANQLTRNLGVTTAARLKVTVEALEAEL